MSQMQQKQTIVSSSASKRSAPQAFNDHQLPPAKLLKTQINSFPNPPIVPIITTHNPRVKECEFDNTEFAQLIYNDAFSEYEPKRLKFGKPHPYCVVESRSLATEDVPPIQYHLKIPDKIINKGILSNVQLEAVIYACQKHEEFLYDGKRAGFLIGDGAGVGKGREISGIILENYLMNRKKSIWISVSNNVREDAKRDIRDVGKEIDIDIKVKALNRMSYSEINSEKNKHFNEGILFVTYSSLIRHCRNVKPSYYKTRFDQIVSWFGKDYDGVIVLDECHKAKNFYNKNQTQTGKIVIKLQDTLQNARIVYASATSACEPKHMAYMTRLGLWGVGTIFETFQDFESTVSKHGVAAMELIAIEMKRKGMYIARQLSFQDVKFEIRETKVEDSKINDHKFVDVYNKCVEIWNNVYMEFNKAFKRNKSEFEKSVNICQTQFWSTHQRFFRYLCISSKIQECVKIATKEIQQGKCIVIGLQSTGETNTENALEENFGDLFDFVSNAKSVLTNLIKKYYPSQENLQKLQDKKENKTNNKTNVDQTKPTKLKIEKEGTMKQENSESEYDSDCESIDEIDFHFLPRSRENKLEEVDVFFDDHIIQEKLLKDVNDMDSMFPINVLDQLIYEFGGPDFVAEMTGRKGRMVENDGNISYESRTGRKELNECKDRINGQITIDEINLLEKDRFNNGEKIVAIISDAASTGISLHSDKRFQNQRERFHITLELPWSAEKAIQQFGRTHRSNQVTPPHYLFLISDLPGEKRFAATVAKRLESLGALTHGDRRCADNRDFGQFNLDNKYGNKAIKRLFSSIFDLKNPTVHFPEKYVKELGDFKTQASEALKNVGLTSRKIITVNKFLNRILGIELNMQNALFEYFIDIIEFESNKAKKFQRFDHGIRDIINENDNIFKNDLPEIIKLNSKNEKDNIEIHKVTNILTGMCWDKVKERYLKNPIKNMFCVSKGDVMEILAFAEHQKDEEYKLITANFAEKAIDRKSLESQFEKISYSSAEKSWKHLYNESEYKCQHIISKRPCFSPDTCNYGKRVKHVYIITGAIFVLWKIIGLRFKTLKLDIVRVELNDGSKLVGVLVSERLYKKIVEALSVYFNNK